MFESCAELVSEYADLEQQLADPAVHGDQTLARKLGRRYAELGPVVSAYKQWLAVTDDVVAARELATEDEAFAAELPDLVAAEAAAAERLTTLLLPRDPMDDKDVILEIKSGEGGLKLLNLTSVDIKTLQLPLKRVVFQSQVRHHSRD